MKIEEDLTEIKAMVEFDPQKYILIRDILDITNARESYYWLNRNDNSLEVDNITRLMIVEQLIQYMIRKDEYSKNEKKFLLSLKSILFDKQNKKLKPRTILSLFLRSNCNLLTLPELQAFASKITNSMKDIQSMSEVFPEVFQNLSNSIASPIYNYLSLLQEAVESMIEVKSEDRKVEG